MRNVRRRARGSALTIAIIVVVIVAGLAAAFLTVSVYQSRTSTRAASGEKALAVAEAGIDDTLFRMNNWTGGSNMTAHTQVLSGGNYTVALTPPFNGDPATYTLRSTGVVPEGRRGIEAVVARGEHPLRRFGAFGRDSVRMDSNSSVDSYDSSLGTYASQNVNGSGPNQHAGSAGDVGSNGNVTMASNTRIWGDLSVGGTATGTTGKVSGTTSTGTEAVEFLPILIPPSIQSMPAIPANYGSNTTLVSGSYHFTALTLGSNTQLTIRGPAKIVVDGTFRADSNTAIIVDSSGGPVDFYLKGAVEVTSNTVIRANNREPADIQINITTDNSSGTPVVEMDSNSEIYAHIYAPNAIMTMNSNGHLYGSVVARRLQVDSNFRVTYDDASPSRIFLGDYRVRSWRQFVP